MKAYEVSYILTYPDGTRKGHVLHMDADTCIHAESRFLASLAEEPQPFILTHYEIKPFKEDS